MSELHLSLPLKVDAQKAFAALVDPKALTTWFAQHVDIDPNKKHYDFWGKHTPGAPDHDEGRHELTTFEQGRRIQYQWHLRGAQTQVEYDITPTDGGCTLQMHHTSIPDLKPYESSVGDFWSHVLEGLRQWLENGKAYELMDYEDIPQGDVHLAVNIAATPHEIFLGLSEPSWLNRWIASDAKVDPKPGGVYDYGWGAGPTKILEIESDKKLSYSWKWDQEPETVTTWELEESGGGTRLTVVQSGFAPDRNSEDYYIGWYKFICRFKAMLESGPDWARIQTVKDTEPA